MLRSVFTKALRDRRRGLVWWTLGLVGLVELYVLVYPTVRDRPELNRLVQDYPEVLRAFLGGESIDFTSAAGYLSAELFSFLAPLLLLVFAVGLGAGAVAGEEERGTLELLLAAPLSRRRLVAEKLLALGAMVVLLGLVLWLALAAGAAAVGMGIGLGRLGAAVTSTVLLALAFGAVALLVGAATGRRGLAIGIAASGAVAAYLVHSLAPLVDVLEPLRVFSPYYHYAAEEPLRSGLHADHAAVLVGLAAAAAALAPLAFERRDVRIRG